MIRYYLNHDTARKLALDAVRTAAAGVRVTIDEPKRSNAQNDKLHALLSDVALQKLWHGERLTLTEWKRLFSAAVFREKMLPGIDGGIVIVPKFTSDMNKHDVSELIDFVLCWGAENEIKFDLPKHD